jgi:ribose transport system permease protein
MRAESRGTESGRGRREALRQLARLRTLGIFLSLLFLLGFFGWKVPHFLHLGNLQTMASQTVIVGLAAIGMTLVIISRGIDLSVGSVIAFSMVVTAWSIQAGLGLLAPAILGVCAGLACGLANGLLVTGFRLIPFIATLGMMGIARGFAKLIARSQTINVHPPDWERSWLFQLTQNPLLPGREPLPGMAWLPWWLLFAPAVWLLVALAAACAAILRNTVFGRHVFAIGSNEAAARLCGVRVPEMKLAIYALCGLFSGFAGVVFASRQAQGDPTAALGLELDVIAAVVIGGGSLSGGEGSVFGALIGAAIMTVLRTGLLRLNVPAPWQEVLIGLIIVVAVVADQLQHRER